MYAINTDFLYRLVVAEVQISDTRRARKRDWPKVSKLLRVEGFDERGVIQNEILEAAWQFQRREVDGILACIESFQIGTLRSIDRCQFADLVLDIQRVQVRQGVVECPKAGLIWVIDKIQFCYGSQQFDAFQVADSVEGVMSAVGLHLLVTDDVVLLDVVKGFFHLRTEIVVREVRGVDFHLRPYTDYGERNGHKG